MKYFSNKTLLFLLACFSFHCYSTSAYLLNRRDDFSDIIGFSTDASIGASVSVGPVTTGIILAQSFLQIRNGSICFTGNISERAFFGLFDAGSKQPCTDVQYTIILGLGNNLLLHKETVTDFELSRRGKEYSYKMNPPLFFYGRVKIRLGLGAGITVELNWIELIDFLAGIFGLDPLADDTWYIVHPK